MTPYGRKHLAAVAAQVGIKWGVSAPFPPAKVTDKWLEWRRCVEYLEVLKKDLADDEKRYPHRVKDTKASISRWEKKIEKLKCPAPYTSWEHVADLHAKAKDAEFYNHLLNLEDVKPAKRELCQLMSNKLVREHILPQ